MHYVKHYTDLKVNNEIFSFEIDSGSPVTVINLDDARRHFGKSTIQKNDTELESYCGTPLQILGFIYVDVTTNTVHKNVKMYIARSKRNPLLGREWMSQIKLDWAKILEKFQHRNEVLAIQSSTATTKCENNQVLQKVVNKFSKLFSSSMGKITGTQARLFVKDNAVPVFIKPRRVPFPLMKAVENELNKLVEDDIMEKVDTSDWATPIVAVRKANNQVRLCGDYKVTINPSLQVDEYPLPSIDELFASMAGGEKFTKIDLSKAYLQLEVHPDDRHLLTLNTHKGLYRPKRLMFGVASAPAKWQKYMEQLLRDIEGVVVFLDDIKITAPDDAKYLLRLEEVFQRLNRNNMRVNLDKSEFMKDRIEYCGYLIDRHGIHKMQSKMDAILQMKRPTSKEEVRSFIGLINYYGRFVSNLSTMLHPLYNLIKDGVDFVWNEICEKSFGDAKNVMQSDTVLVHYNPKLPLVLAVDASPYGVGAVLSHTFADGTEKPIQYASQTLSDVQKRYSQIDREAYAIIFGVKKFYQFIFGRRFTLITDNKPIAQIISPKASLPLFSATRMQHYAIFLSSFDYEVRHKKSNENANADAMSRLPIPSATDTIEELDVVEINMIETLPVTTNELGEAT